MTAIVSDWATGRRRRLFCRLALWAGIGLVAVGAHAADHGKERLLISTPTGYVVASQEQHDSRLITQLLPRDQSARGWHDKLTIRVFAQQPVKTPAAFRRALIARWREQCPGAESAPISDGYENGYAFAVWVMACEQGAAPDSRQFAWFKAIQGRAAFYLVQRSFAYAPDQQTVRRWMRYLRAIEVCDSRLPDRACPLPGHDRPEPVD